MTIPTFDELARHAATIRAEIAELAPTTGLAIYGTGFLGQWAAGWLVNAGHHLVACFDGNSAKVGTTINAIPVHAPADLSAIAPDLVLITARHAVPAISRMLVERGQKHMPFEAFYVARHFDRFADEHQALPDERSREVLRAVIAAMLSGDNRVCEAVFEKDQYFALPRFCGAEKEIYVDAGAYVGDSLERFIWAHYGVFEAIHAFEPGSRQFQALKVRSERLLDEWALAPETIRLNAAALGAGDGQMSGGTQSGQLQSLSLHGATGGEDIPVTSLDAYLAGGRVTFLKADVEGMEMALLRGASLSISRFRPKIAICVYHYPSDIPDITGYLRSLVPDYKFALRHHSPQLLETVLYAWTD